ncbi:hypothetical protein [Streptomyces rochei]|uniref:hypothetical protein n=1 Tax=Streptomyces rochei TaxID=1928 RepID=UPI003675FA52
MSRIFNRSLAAKVSLAAILATGAGLSVAPVASATDGNKVNNCLGQYFSTSWQQVCQGSGATAAGKYWSEAECDWEGNWAIAPIRKVGSKSVEAGHDCTFSVSDVMTRYQGS